jgi:tRNA pseudouridine32 synthase / 23S rRNA pseudouridine746 synthase
VRAVRAAVKPAASVGWGMRGRAATLGVMKAVYADDHLLVLDKAAGLLSVPGRGEAGLVNLTTQAQALWPDACVVHRLDQATSGLIILARGAAAQRALSMAFEARAVHKQYEAVVEGHLAQPDGVITAPLIVDWPNRPRQKVCPLTGKPALTRWWRLQADSGRSRVLLEPVTGRSHQLRVHLLSIGHAIVGDELYGQQPPSATRLLLHARRLAFAHPITGAALRFDSEPPFDLETGLPAGALGYSAGALLPPT